MTEGNDAVSINDLIATTAKGVLRALDARDSGAAKVSTQDLVKSGFIVDVRIRAGGIRIPSFESAQPNQAG